MVSPPLQLYEGPGWKLGYNAASSDPASFSAVIGTESWSLTLRRAEYEDFVQASYGVICCLRPLDNAGAHLGGGTEAFPARRCDWLWLGQPTLCSALPLQRPTTSCRSQQFGIGLHACPPAMLLLTNSAKASWCCVN